ncbi:hypothetical protein RKD27_003994 [Streptomyces sp. SAI-126]
MGEAEEPAEQEGREVGQRAAEAVVRGLPQEVEDHDRGQGQHQDRHRGEPEHPQQHRGQQDEPEIRPQVPEDLPGLLAPRVARRVAERYDPVDDLPARHPVVDQHREDHEETPEPERRQQPAHPAPDHLERRALQGLRHQRAGQAEHDPHGGEDHAGPGPPEGVIADDPDQGDGPEGVEVAVAARGPRRRLLLLRLGFSGGRGDRWLRFRPHHRQRIRRFRHTLHVLDVRLGRGVRVHDVRLGRDVRLPRVLRVPVLLVVPLRLSLSLPVPLLLPAHRPTPAGVPTSPVRFSFCQRRRPPVSAVMQEWMRTRYIIWR